MFCYNPYINLSNGTKSDRVIKTYEKACDCHVTAVYVEARTAVGIDERKTTFNSDAGVCIEVKPQDKIKRYMANYRHSPWWCRPVFGENLCDIPGDTQLLVLEKENGSFVVLVPVVNDTCRCVFRGMEENVFQAELSSWYDKLYSCTGLAFVYAEGDNPNQLIEACVKEALHCLDSSVRHISERRYPELMEYLGWCSWDSMQIRVNENGLLEKCEEFQQKGIPVKWAILDDMWAEIRDFYGQTYENKIEMIRLMHSAALYHYEADPIRFPNGLKNCIEKMKQYGLKIGMWMPTTGYWRGIDPKGTAYKELKDWLVQTEDGLFVPDWHREKAYRYFAFLHDFFQKCGADFVKIDKQSICNIHYHNIAPVGQTAKEYHAGLDASVGEHFDNCVINCMGMSSEDIWSRPISPISRCSDDFQPEDSAWFAKHVMQCAYNSLLQGQFYWCDWDMWWTDDSQAEKNSVMRAISGGPIYVSDEIGRSRAEVLKPLALSDGRIIRCDRPAKPTTDCITVNPVEEPIALKVQNMVGEYGVMAVLNINQDNIPVTTSISGKQIDGFCADEYVVYDYFEKNIIILKSEENFEISLKDRDEYKLYLFAPIHNGFAVIGRTDKFISPGTIKDIQGENIFLKENGPYAYVKDGMLVEVSGS